jgi:hypothetical protein
MRIEKEKGLIKGQTLLIGMTIVFLTVNEAANYLVIPGILNNPQHMIDTNL